MNLYTFASDYSLFKMTEKQQKIIDAALFLFAEEGYKATPTSKVAIRAGVSEGLIFRHFKNKEGLLEAIMDEGATRSKLLFADVVLETAPKKVLLNFIDIAEKIASNKEDINFWKLQFKLKWEMEVYSEAKMAPLQIAITSAFKNLNYAHPEKEATMLILWFEGLATRYFLNKDFNMADALAFMKSKHNLEKHKI